MYTIAILNAIILYLLMYMIQQESKKRKQEIDNLRDRYYELTKDIVQRDERITDIENELNSIKSLNLYLLKEKDNIIKINNK